MTDLFADRLTIEGDGTSVGTRVLLDGKPLTGVQGVSWSAGVSQRTTVTLVLFGHPTLHITPAEDQPPRR